MSGSTSNLKVLMPASPIIIGEMDGLLDPHIRVEWRMFFHELWSRSGGSVGGGAGVASWNGRTGAVTMTVGDITGTGGAPIASPAFSGNPTAPTPTAGDNDTSLATTAFVHAAITALPAGVASFNTRTGTVVLLAADVTGVGGALLSQVPVVSTTLPLMDGTAAIGSGTKWAAADHIHPTDTSRYAASNPAGYVTAAGAATAAPVQSVATRTGAITLTHADITDWAATLAPYAPLASPTFTGTPTLPTGTVAVTQTAGNSTTAVATTAFVEAMNSIGWG
jgi:hypothetical protein